MTGRAAPGMPSARVASSPPPAGPRPQDGEEKGPRVEDPGEEKRGGAREQPS